jgi:dihydroorotate dehydrogenase (fumarate)
MRLRDWMDRHRYETVDQLRGRLSQRSVPDPAAFERANYLKVLASRSPR